LIAYPDLDKETSFEFSYWVGSEPPPAKGGNMGMVIGIVVAVLVIGLILIAVMKIRRNKERSN